MTRKSLNLTDNLYEYMLSVSLQETKCQRELRKVTASHKYSNMQISPEQGQFMAFLVYLTQARNIIEIGTFTGYSALSMAQALPDDGHLITCDVDPETTALARQYWERAGVGDKIELRLGPAIETLDKMLGKNSEPRFDMAFIDAEKTEYRAYYDRLLKLLHPGGLIMIDNVLWSGKPANPEINDVDTVAIREFNQYLAVDSRVMICLLPISDGLTLALKR